MAELFVVHAGRGGAPSPSENFCTITNFTKSEITLVGADN
jgi:hypothetical protein